MIVQFETPGRGKLAAWASAGGIGPSEISRRLGLTVLGKAISPSVVSRWLSGHSRPDPVYRPRLKALANIDESDWLTENERAATATAPKGEVA